VLLLVILGLLSMFAMVAVAFVVLTSFERQRGERDRRVDEAADPPDRQLDQAMRVVVRGQPNGAGGVHFPSLLEKIYGHETLGAARLAQTGLGLPIGALQPVTGGSNAQLLEFALPSAQMTAGEQAACPDAFHRAGAVLTMTSGTAAGLSTRIVGVDPSSVGNMQIMAFEGGVVPQATDTCIINGVPYSGMGLGYDANTSSQTYGTTGGTVSVGGQTCPLPLVPFHQNNWGPGPNASGWQDTDSTHWLPAGGANCDYTAPDYQDPLLAFQTFNTSGQLVTALPSLHRPELIAYWGKQCGGIGSIQPDLMRAIMARPAGPGMGASPDHPNFTGSNPRFDPVNGPWDVDNVGTGTPDSVWVDLGFPVRYTAEGKPYKPLIALLCLDLDGRLNVNAHGMLAQAQTSLYSGNYQQLAAASPSSEVAQGAMGGNVVLAPSAGSGTLSSTATATLPRGQGYGPAEVNLLPLFADSSGNYHPQQYSTVLTGIPANGLFPSGLNGRYGELGGTPQPGIANWLWPDTFNKWWDYQGASSTANQNYWSYRSAPGSAWTDAYLSPPDPQGYGAVALDVAGRPLWMSMGTTCINTPYDLNLSRNAPHAVDSAPADDAFGPAELEAVLRPFDRDAGTLPKRLLALSATDSSNPATSSLLAQKRYAVTTESQSVPTPGLAMPPAIRSAMKQAGMGRPRHIVDLLLAMGVPQPKWRSLLPPEMLAGLKLNLNRPLSNWPGTSGGTFQLYSKPGNSPDWKDQGGGFTLDPLGTPTDPDTTPPSWGGLGVKNPTPMGPSGQPKNAIAARQLQARYLYVLAMLLRQPSGALQAFSEFPASDSRAKQLTQRRIAQWAINVVSFSTPDSVMVPFKYPLNWDPTVASQASQGWPLQDNLIDTQNSDPSKKTQDAADKFGVVWGAKPPELLLTETLAFHDRRVADTAWNIADPNDTQNQSQKKKRLDWVTITDNNGNQHTYLTLVDEALNLHPSLDQPRIPQGSAFIEVFCPRSPRLSAAPADLYMKAADPLGGGNSWYLDLGQLAGAPPGQPNNAQASTDGCKYPVWRIVISESRILKQAQDNVGTPPGMAGVSTGRLYQYPDSSSLEPEQVSTVSGPATAQSLGLATSGAFSLLTNPDATNGTNVTIERIVWLAPLSPVQGNKTALDGNRVYYNRGLAASSPLPLPAGRYAVVGPARANPTHTTAVGTVVDDTNGYLGTASPQRVALAASTVSLAGVTVPVCGAAATSNQGYPDQSMIQQPLGIPVGGGGQGGSPQATPLPNGWSNQTNTCPNGIGLSISEPVFSDPYYTEPTAAGSDGVTEWYGDYTMQAGNQFPQQAMDTDSAKNYPLLKDHILPIQPSGSRSVPYYKTVFLQRLANPAAAYDPINNPYRTVDWMPIDLTVFNGEDRGDVYKQGLMTSGVWNQICTTPQTPPGNAGGNAQPPVDPTTKQAPLDSTKYAWDPDDQNYPGDAGYTTKTNFWSRQRGTVTNTADPHYSGNVTWNIWAQISDPPVNPAVPGTTTAGGPNKLIHFPFDLQHTLGYINSPFWNPAGSGQIFPFQTAPTGWITHAAGISDTYVGDPLLPWPWLTWNGRPYVNEMELLLVPASHPGRLLWEFGFVNAQSQTTNGPFQDPGSPQVVAYPHLADFFQSEGVGQSGTAMEMHRLLEFVGVPSRFACAQTQINPQYATTGAHSFHPPFNRVSNYRDPGKINLNTIPSIEVLQGLLNYFPGMGDSQTNVQNFWSKFILSRQGGSGSGASDASLPNNSSPTRFMNPFRSSASAGMLPTGLLPSNQREVDATLLRGVTSGSAQPLFELDGNLTGNNNPPLYADYNRNAFFRYQELTRLANCVTTRSNVFAVWITVGYFEVSPAPVGDPSSGPYHPDGWQLGQELGSDTGKIERHRAFYIFDRSIPVGFIRGRDVNQDKALLLRRFIE
jgi:hypothetical protein